jgi:hypothetical protein
MSDLLTFSFDNEDIKGGFEKYKGTKNQIDRVGIIFSDPKSLFSGLKVHYKDRYFQCKKGKCCEVLGPPKFRIGAVIIKYSTDKQGNIKKPFEYEIFPWHFGEGTYIKMKNTNSEFPLTTHDIKLNCTNDEYQNFDITPCSECIWTAKEELKNLVLEQARPYWDYVRKSIAPELSVEEINELLGVGGSTGASALDPSAGLDLDSVLNKV